MRPTTSAARDDRNSREQRVLAAQLGLLYASSNLGAGVTVLAATILSGLQWGMIRNQVILGWWISMILVAALRFTLKRRYTRASSSSADIRKLRINFTVAVGLTGVGWGLSGFLLYPQAHLLNQVFLIFVLGGMMLGAASLLAPRPEAFLAYLLPTGLVPSIRLFAQGDETHIAMGLLAVVFTVAILVTTTRIYRTVDSSLRLEIENRDLVEDLRTANDATEALNQALERRVEERTAELHEAAERLRAEITQREQTEEELLRARKLESLGVLAGGIAHDFNNFLTVVQGNIEVAKGQLDLKEPALLYLDQAAKACQRAAILSSQLLTFAKGGTPVRRVISVAKLVTEAVQLANTGSPNKIDLSIADGLWPARVDPGQISQVLHNILLNAREAMPGGGAIEVRVENVASDGCNDGANPHVRISIRDHGCGISDDCLPRIFDPYFTTKPGGNGLGLATAYAIVVKHEGSISVESALGVGTIFTIDLPASHEVPATPAAVASHMQRGTERLLVMDDEEDLRTLFKAVLTKLGYDVETARDGAEALSLYGAARATGTGFDAVLLDLTVKGGMGGMEAAARLKELYPDSKLIVSSGYSDAPVMSEFGTYGFDAVILKPWRVTEMSEVLRSVLVPDAVRRGV